MSSTTETNAAPAPALKKAAQIGENLARILAAGIPKLRLLLHTGFPLILCTRHKDELIDDDECDDVFQAPETGIYRRFATSGGGTTGHRWLYLCRPDQLAEVLSREIEALDPLDRETILPEASLQALRSQDALANRKKREASRVAREASLVDDKMSHPRPR